MVHIKEIVVGNGADNAITDDTRGNSAACRRCGFKVSKWQADRYVRLAKKAKEADDADDTPGGQENRK